KPCHGRRRTRGPAGCDPIANGSVFERIGIVSPAAVLAHGAAGFLQNEALIRMKGIGATTEAVAGQGGEIAAGVFPAEGELEPAFAVLVAVTGPGIAAGP